MCPSSKAFRQSFVESAVEIAGSSDRLWSHFARFCLEIVRYLSSHFGAKLVSSRSASTANVMPTESLADFVHVLVRHWELDVRCLQWASRSEREHGAGVPMSRLVRRVSTRPSQYAGRLFELQKIGCVTRSIVTGEAINGAHPSTIGTPIEARACAAVPPPRFVIDITRTFLDGIVGCVAQIVPRRSGHGTGPRAIASPKHSFAAWTPFPPRLARPTAARQPIGFYPSRHMFSPGRTCSFRGVATPERPHRPVAPPPITFQQKGVASACANHNQRRRATMSTSILDS